MGSESDWMLQGCSHLVSEEKCLIHHFLGSKFQGFKKNMSCFFAGVNPGFSPCTMIIRGSGFAAARAGKSFVKLVFC